ncbi:MAG: metal ABC transporter ATP-binding protein [Actinomycetales bacterium]
MTLPPDEAGASSLAPSGAGPGGPVVAVRDLSVGYDSTVVVRDVSFTVEAGDVVAVLGTNGSGKSTLVKGLLGVATRVGGQVEIAGSHREIGYVPQRLNSAGPVPATVYELVVTGRLGGRRWFIKANQADRRAVEQALELVGLDDLAHHPVTELSGGQHRRALIARALVSRPRLLVMDEPTAGVDTTQQQVLARTLRRLSDTGVTMIIVTHEIGPFTSLLTRALVMREGRLSYDGPITPELLGRHDVDHHHHEPLEPDPLITPLLTPPGGHDA